MAHLGKKLLHELDNCNQITLGFNFICESSIEVQDAGAINAWQKLSVIKFVSDTNKCFSYKELLFNSFIYLSVNADCFALNTGFNI